jgi:hypothetical protein
MNKLGRAVGEGWKLVSRVFFISPPFKKIEKGRAEAAGSGDQQEGGGTFVTWSSLSTFAGATVAISGLSKWVLLLPWPWVHNAQGVTIGCSTFIGIAIVICTVTTGAGKPTDFGQWCRAIFVGFLNIVYLTLVSLGVWHP